MKKIIIALLLTTSFAFATKTEKDKEGVYNDIKQASSTIYKDAKTLAPKIETAVTEVAKGLKVGAESVWNILVKQQLVWSICFLILTLSSLFNWYLFYKRTYTSKDKIEYTVLERDIIGDILNPNYESYYGERSQYKNDPRAQTHIKGAIGKEQYNAPKYSEEINSKNKKVFYYVHLMICLILSYFSFIHFSDMLTGFINPEFGAMKNIAEIALQLK